jgi:hypothetical protein
VGTLSPLSAAPPSLSVSSRPKSLKGACLVGVDVRLDTATAVGATALAGLPLLPAGMPPLYTGAALITAPDAITPALESLGTTASMLARAVGL